VTKAQDVTRRCVVRLLLASPLACALDLSSKPIQPTVDEAISRLFEGVFVATSERRYPAG
jgi:hypothetical protein